MTMKGFDSDIDHPLIRSELQRIKCRHAVVETQQRIRRPAPLSILLDARSLSAVWDFGWDMLWLGLYTSFFLLVRSSEIFAETTDVPHPVYCLGRHDVACFKGSQQLRAAREWLTDCVEVRFRGSKGTRLRRRAIVSRVRVGAPALVQCGGGAVDLVAELVAARLYHPADAPLMAYGWRNGRLVRNKHVAADRGGGRPAAGGVCVALFAD